MNSPTNFPSDDRLDASSNPRAGGPSDLGSGTQPYTRPDLWQAPYAPGPAWPSGRRGRRGGRGRPPSASRWGGPWAGIGRRGPWVAPGVEASGPGAFGAQGLSAQGPGAQGPGADGPDPEGPDRRGPGPAGGDEWRGPGRGPRGPHGPGPGRGPGGRGRPGFPFGPPGPVGFGPGGPGRPGRGRGRSRRGDVRAAILRLLGEQPMHGYQILGELAERSGGRWRPSPGSVYPRSSSWPTRVSSPARSRRAAASSPSPRPAGRSWRRCRPAQPRRGSRSAPPMAAPATTRAWRGCTT